MASARSSGVLTDARFRRHEVKLRGTRFLGLARIRRSLCREVGLIDASIFRAVRQNDLRLDLECGLLGRQCLCRGSHRKSRHRRHFACKPQARFGVAISLQFRSGGVRFGRDQPGRGSGLRIIVHRPATLRLVRGQCFGEPHRQIEERNIGHTLVGPSNRRTERFHQF